MALTSAQIVAIRYYMGYSVTGDAAYAPYRELAYSDVSYMGIALDDPTGQGGRLQNLSVDEEAKITGFFLPNLAAREQEIQCAAGNLGTDIAAVWTRNKNEIGDRTALFTRLRLDLCLFLGFPPGQKLTAGNRVGRF